MTVAIRRGAACGLALLLTADASAQEPILLDDILVSAARRPVAADSTGRAYSVVTAEEIERRQIRYAADALRGLPGVAVSRTGGVGATTTVNLRGADGNQVLVLIDGVEVSAIGDGAYDFSGLLADDIARIEVLRGPQSALYGSNAAAGVISIITKSGRAGEAEAGFRLETGSDLTRAASGFLRAGGETWNFAASAGARATEGFDISAAGDGEKDGDDRLFANLKGGIDLTPDLRLSGNARLEKRRSDFDDFAGGVAVDGDGETDQTSLFAGTTLRHEALDDRLVSELRLEYTDIDSDSLDDGLEVFQNAGRRYHASGQTSLSFGLGDVSTHVVTAAVDYEREVNVAQTRDFAVFPPAILSETDQTREIFGLVGEWRATLLDDFDLQAGVRQDFNDEFEDAFTYSVGAAWRVPDTGARLHASVGEGVTNPTFIEQFGFFPDSFVGNPDLEPERTFGWDIGVEQTLADGAVVVDATYFRATVTDQIISGFDAEAGLPTSVNDTGESARQGVELALTARPLPRLTVDASYTWTLAQQVSGLQEPRRPRHSGRLAASWGFLDGRATATAEALVVGERRDLDFATFPAGSARLDPYVRLDVAGSYRLTDQARLFARVENVTDADYEEVLGYSAQGITGFAGLEVSFR